MSPPSTLLCLENALTDGNVVPVGQLTEACAVAKRRGLAVHLDGARIFNAAFALGVEPQEIANAADSVMFCLSKGLCAPVGSMLCGCATFIEKARKNRKMIGGGMRQAGVIAAAGIVALQTMIGRLPEDHANALYLAELLEAVPGVHVIRERLKINMVFWRAEHAGFNEPDFVKFMAERGIKCNGYEFPGEFRFVTHHDVDKNQLKTVVDALKEYVAAL